MADLVNPKIELQAQSIIEGYYLVHGRLKRVE
jgi:hypothetical protein